MKTFTTLLFALWTVAASAQTNVLFFNVANVANPQLVKGIRTTLTDTTPNPRMIAGHFMNPVVTTTFVQADGKAYFTNVAWGTYNWTMKTSPEVSFDIQVETNTTGLVDGGILTGVTNVPNPLSEFYNKAQVDTLLADLPASTNGGTVVGPSSSAIGNLAYFDQITGQHIGDTGIPYVNVASQSQLQASNTIYQAQFVANIPLTNMSPLTGNNEYIDMESTPHGAGRSLGVSFGGKQEAFLWTANGSGTGSNVWGGAFAFPGGMDTAGNKYWLDLPKANWFFDQSFYWGMGPTASGKTNAFPNGYTNGTAQPGLSVVQANPHSGIAYVNMRQAFTNSSHGFLQGTNIDGESVYIPDFGYVLGLIGDSYGNVESNGVITQIGKYAQQAPSYQGLISSDYSLNYYISLNAHRIGDPWYGGQAPLMAIETDHFLDGGTNKVLAGFPVQAGGVWDVRQANDNAPTNWQWAFVVDESTGAPTVATTNSLLQVGAMTVSKNQTNAADIYVNGVFHGNGSSLANLTHSSTVTFASGGTVALSQNADGSTNYALTVTAGGSGTVTSVNVAKNGHTSSGAVTGAGTITLTRTGTEDFFGLGATNIGSLQVTGSVQVGASAGVSSLVVTNGATNLSLTASTLLAADANKKQTSIANGAGALTNDSLGNFGYAPLLDASALTASSHVKTGPTTNLVSSEDATGYTNTIPWTHEGTTTNITATFNGTLQTFTVTNGPTVFFHYSGANGSISYRIYSTNFTTLAFDFQPKWLAGSNNVITNGVLSLTSYGGTNMATPAQLEAAIKENQ